MSRHQEPSASKRGLLPSHLRAAFVLAVAAFLIRCFNWRHVFVGGEVHFEEFDPFGHMRRVMLTVAHWPHVPQFDYYTNFPDGAKLAWGPGLDFLLATVSLILGLGSPLEADIERWSALAIPVLGALSVVCAYFLARELVGRGAAFLAAAIVAILPVHVFLGVLGRVDHHVTEPLLASLLFLFFLRAARSGRWQDAWLGGLAQALGVLFWPGAILFSAVLLLMLLAECTLAACARRVEPEALRAGSRTLVAATVLTAAVVPVSLWGREGDIVYVAVSWFQPLALAGFALTLTLSRWTGGRVRAGLSPLGAGGLLLAGVALLGGAALAIPPMRATIRAGVGYLLTTDPIMRTISESKSPLTGTDFVHFFWLFSYWSLLLPLALLWLARDPATWKEGGRSFRRRFVLIVTTLGTALVLKQERHCAIFTVFMPVAVAAAIEDLGTRIRSTSIRRAGAVLLFVVVSAQQLWLYTGARKEIEHDPVVTPLLEALTWMRYNTPPTSEGIRRGDVPAYGVMGYFGMGMYLNYVARRPNVGTPLAQLPWHDEAIRETFRFEFAEREVDALRLLERHRVRYVVTIPFYLFLKNGALILGLNPERWLHDTRTYEEQKIPSRFAFRAPYFDLVVSRLLLFDGSEATVRGRTIAALGRLRLVHECPQPLNWSNFGDWSPELPTDLRYCKIYELVRGARITGRALPFATVRISLPVRADLSRRFTYRSRTRSDGEGSYTVTVPYSTAASEGVHAEGPYRIDLGNGKTVDLRVPEKAVIEGWTVAAPAGALDTSPRRRRIEGDPKGAGLTGKGT